MCWRPFFCSAFLTFYSLISVAGGSPLEVMSAPNLLRVGAAENIFVEIQDCVRQDDINVQISLMNFPTKSKMLASTFVTLTRANNYQEFARITIPVKDFRMDSNIKQYVYLQAEFPNQVLEKVVLVSFQSAYVFIQTDKPIYSPGERVHYRIFGVNPDMEPMDHRSDMFLDIVIVTPEGIVLPSEPLSLNSGITFQDYFLPEIASYGLWKVVAKVSTNPQTSFEAKFEVKEHVPSSFEVKLIPSRSFFYVDSTVFTVNIRTTYVFGEEVDGTAYALFGITDGRYKSSLPGSLQRVTIERGVGAVTLTKEQITQSFPNINELLGKSIFVAVTVLTENGGEMTEAELSDIKIVASPYTIHFKKTVKYFKPGMPFDVTIKVVNPDNTPAQNVAVVVDPGSVADVTAASGMAKLTINTDARSETITVTARTNDLQFPPQRQASASMTALSFQTKSNHFLLINVDASIVQLGENVRVKLFLNRQENEKRDITYLLLSRGQLVKHGRYQIRGQVLVTLTLHITKELMPSFRIVAYYHTNADEVVSDSVWVDVKDSCMGSLKLEPVRPAANYQPRKAFQVKITGDPGATVGLVAVEKSAYVQNDKLHFTQEKIWDVMEQGDTGCSPGGGKDSMNVFYDAGLLFKTRNALETPDRTELKCSTSSRKKRAAALINMRTRLASSFFPVSHYEDKEQRECCLDGMRNVLVSRTCERRSDDFIRGSACTEAFIRCCKEMEQKQDETRGGTYLLPRTKRSAQEMRGKGDDAYIDRDIIRIRTRFSESWLWENVMLNACPHSTPNCESTSLVKTFVLPDSMTTWELTGISLSRTHGMCVSDPLEIITWENFFIDLRLPYSAVHGEQVEIKAILHNYSPDPIIVRVDIREEYDVCNAAYKKGMYSQEVQVGAQTTRSVSFIIIPMKLGDVPVEITAAVKNSLFSDAVRKMLRVVPEGTLVKSVKIVRIDPLNEGVDGRQVIRINSEILPSNIAPNTPMSTEISLTGIEQRPLLSKDVISGRSVGTLIRDPTGSGEENMIATAESVIATVYLDITNQWETVGFGKRNEAVQHIRKGYQNELVYRKSDGSFSVLPIFPHLSSTWLTAFVAKVFSKAHNLIAMQNHVVCDAIKYLALNTQRPDGVFNELGRVFTSTMTGDVSGIDSDASMTAFCVIAMQESRSMCEADVHSLPGTIALAVRYLEQRLPSLTNPYAVAMVSYALANENKLNQEILYKFAAPERSHWPVPKGTAYTFEATAYALLALVKAKAFEEAKHVVAWLSQQQGLNGDYGSTQATVMVYQAAAEYWMSVEESDYDLDVNIFLPSRSKPNKYKFNRQNHYKTRMSKFSDINKDVIVIATGTGEATLRMVSLFYALPQEQEGDCQKFNLTLQLSPEKISDDEEIYSLTIKVLYKDKERDATMSLLDVGLPTGFTFNKRDLDSLSTGDARVISKYNPNSALSERGSLIIYLDKVSHTEPEVITFRIHQEMKVRLLQPTAVSVYEYYDQTPCVKFYRPARGETRMTLCREKECICAEENCSMQKKEKIRNEDRFATSCNTHFVYKVRVETFADGLSADIYTMRIMEAIKEGSTDLGPQGKHRTFLSQKYCREALDLRTSQTYLIMGSSRDIHRHEQNISFQYVLGEKTWVEYWPTAEECQTDKYQPTCEGLEDLVNKHINFGCHS
ncbi:complement C3-like isoform X3 [Cololabis saira]|uniref:complement C3-like isoform X3 n=1 Tax=Cololabis saira TaxID=129043 RepID=UPI002AD4369C|nr:complement C3-like isoform X3 [Cololabis saira]